MTKQEKIIVSAYTGVLMCDFNDLHEYIEKKLGRPVFTHELADRGIQKEIVEKSKDEFLEICKRDSEPELRWIPATERPPKAYQKCLFTVESFHWAGEPVTYEVVQGSYGGEKNFIAWMPSPEPYKGGNEE